MNSRKKSIILSICTIIIFACSSCGGSKQAGRRALEEDKCEQMALDHSNGKLRAYGIATSQNKSFARDNAILSARRELSGVIETAVSSLLTRFRQEYTLGQDADFSEKSAQAVKEVIDQTVQFATVICTSSYELANGNIETHVCIELQSDWKKDVADAIRQANVNNLNLDAEKMKVELDNEINKLRERNEN
ncbi:MAG: hypothetical protein SOR57_11915 [Parabacteroides sp.]|nr:hypothetical protein [Parabacteroides sp.]